ncbi:MAG: cysteine-rich CWC family protein [Luteolibacter sp.]
MPQECDESQCPLCGKPNLCQMHEQGGCWCARVEIPSGLLESVPQEMKMKSCICRDCIERSINSQTARP